MIESLASELQNALAERAGAAMGALAALGVSSEEPWPAPTTIGKNLAVAEYVFALAIVAGDAVDYSAAGLAPNARTLAKLAVGRLWAVAWALERFEMASSNPSHENLTALFLCGAKLHIADRGDPIWEILRPAERGRGRPKGSKSRKSDAAFAREAAARIVRGESPAAVHKDIGQRAMGGGTWESKWRRVMEVGRSAGGQV